MDKKWVGIMLCALLILGVGCQPQAGNQAQTARNDGTSNEGIVRGKGYTSLYRDAQHPQQDQRNARLFTFDRDMGTNRDYDLGNTRTPGTRIGRDQIPYGYASHSANDADVMFQGYGANIYIDRQVVAEAVSQIVVGLQDIEEATVVVADDVCLIGYHGVGNQEEMDEQVWSSGLSVTPRWFKVYTTNDTTTVQRIKDLGTNPKGHSFNVQGLGREIENIIAQVAQTEANQGRKQDTMDEGDMNQDERHKRGIMEKRGFHRMGVQ
ncbi:YhcN/YlaJ family sporulation lipoprotein [Caldalkalibacillus mannanilyticus]|uniref:YhcN/YlaJ family sporulation lipoprotein n=1 Tax=Caldalkalibacillus mannanilyticus TaxID=1418 RepID=UPI000469AD92|nr:YhcN/YlaJ family sporulation lipoprotein [Caldalkalibacillus mannanilyticus]